MNNNRATFGEAQEMKHQCHNATCTRRASIWWNLKPTARGKSNWVKSVCLCPVCRPPEAYEQVADKRKPFPWAFCCSFIGSLFLIQFFC